MATEKKENRPRIDAILRAIREGKYDDKMTEIQNAISDRQKIRRDALMAEIQEVWGENAQVVTHRTPPGTFGGQTRGPGIAIPSAGPGAEPAPIDPNEGVVADDTDDPDEGYESRSPQIS
jgi:hypothetical protein